MERQARYNVKGVRGAELSCSVCDVALGDFVTVNGRVWIKVSGLELRNFHGRCANCGSIVHHDDLDCIWHRRSVEVLMDVE